MKKLSIALIIGIVSLLFGIESFCGTISGDTIACGSERLLYGVNADATGMDMLKFQ